MPNAVLLVAGVVRWGCIKFGPPNTFRFIWRSDSRSRSSVRLLAGAAISLKIWLKARSERSTLQPDKITFIFFCFGEFLFLAKTHCSYIKYVSGINFPKKLHDTYSFVIQRITWKNHLGLGKSHYSYIKLCFRNSCCNNFRLECTYRRTLGKTKVQAM